MFPMRKPSSFGQSPQTLPHYSSPFRGECLSASRIFRRAGTRKVGNCSILTRPTEGRPLLFDPFRSSLEIWGRSLRGMRRLCHPRLSSDAILAAKRARRTGWIAGNRPSPPRRASTQTMALLIIERVDAAPSLGICEGCNAQFPAPPHSIGQVDMAAADIQAQFDRHECKSKDSRPLSSL